MDNTTQKIIKCGDVIYTYEYTGFSRLTPPLSDISEAWLYQGKKPLTENQLLIVSYNKYLRCYEQNVRARYDKCISYGIDASTSKALSTGYLLPPESFGLSSLASFPCFNRSRRRLRDLVFCNLASSSSVGSYSSYTGRFVTLTYASPQFSLVVARSHFRLFIMRLRYYLSSKGLSNFRYIAVSEKHISHDSLRSRFGSYHFHLLLFDTSFIPYSDLLDLWGHGSIDIELVKGDITLVAYYLSKYLSKDFSFYNMRRFVTSQNILRPQVISDPVILPTLRFLTSSQWTTLSGEGLRFTVSRAVNSLKK